MSDPDHRPDPLAELGAFIREQRAMARMSLRRLSELAGISNPYLSQIERGLRRPSAVMPGPPGGDPGPAGGGRAEPPGGGPATPGRAVPPDS